MHAGLERVLLKVLKERAAGGLHIAQVDHLTGAVHIAAGMLTVPAITPPRES